MRILALDSSGAACSAALWADGAIRARRLEAMPRGHAERLLPLLLEVTAEAGTALAAVDLFAATTGPGGFTGVRVGLATLRGLALAASRPMLGITSFAAVAHGTRPAERKGRRLLAVIESKRDELFVQAFSETLEPAGPGVALEPSGIAAWSGTAPLLLAGDGAARACAALAAAGRDVGLASTAAHIDAAVVAALAACRAGEARAEPPAPLYLRPPSVSAPSAAAP